MIPIKAVDNFLCDENYVSLVESAREQRLLYITDLSETRVSAFLGWLFRPHEGHGLGDHVIRELLHNAWKVDTEFPQRADRQSFNGWSPSAIATRSFRDLLVETEYRFGKSESGTSLKRPADIVLVSRANRLVVVIENKFGTSVRREQLKAYREQAEKAFPEYARLLIYLDPNPDNVPDDEGRWIRLDYEWLINLLVARQKSGLLSDMALNALSQMRDYLQEDSVNALGNDQQRQVQIVELIKNHPDVIRAMGEMRMLSAHERLTRGASPKNCGSELLLIEYHQRPKLWNDVLSQAAHAHLIDVLYKRIGHVIDVRRRTKRLFFRHTGWVQLTRPGADKDEAWNVRMAAWRQTDESFLYSVRSVFSFKPIYSADKGDNSIDSTNQKKTAAFEATLEESLRKVAAELRVGRRRLKTDANFVRLDEMHGLTPEQTAEWLIQESNRINKALIQHQLLKPQQEI